MNVYDTAQKFITDLQFNNLLQEYVLEIRNYFNHNKSTDTIALELLVVQPPDQTGKHPSLSVKGIADSGFNNDLKQQMRKAGQKVHKQKVYPVAIFLISEAWVKQFNAKQPQHQSVERYDDKKEILMVTGMTVDKRVNLATIDIQRVKGNKIWLRNPTFELYNPSSEIKIDADLPTQFYNGYLEQIGLNFSAKN